MNGMRTKRSLSPGAKFWVSCSLMTTVGSFLLPDKELTLIQIADAEVEIGMVDSWRCRTLSLVADDGCF